MKGIKMLQTTTTERSFAAVRKYLLGTNSFRPLNY